jgi:nucleoside-diphosphate-sugar epimerase
MRILLTGAGGLLGSHLFPLLIEEGHDVFTISASLKGDKNFNVDFSKEWTVDLLPGDLDAIIHLAQSEDFRVFPGKAEAVFNVNTLSTVKLISFAVKTGVKKFIYASSGGIYGNSNKPITENEVINYNSSLGFYLATKHCSEVVLDNFTSLLDIMQLRFFFIYGKGQRKDMLISRLIENVKTGKAIQLWGEDGMHINPVHANDAARAVSSALKVHGSDKINIGGPEILSLKQLTEIIGEATGNKPSFDIDKDAVPKHIIGSITKMTSLLGPPSIKFKEAIKALI